MEEETSITGGPPNSQYFSLIDQSEPERTHRALKTYKINVIVATMNNPAYLTKALRSIREQSGDLPYKLIVVADDPNMATMEVIEEYDVPPEDCVFNPTRVGCVKAMNQGFQHSKADVYVFTADDTIVTRGWLDKLASGALTAQFVGLVSPVTNASGQGLQQLIRCPNEDYKSIQQLGRWVSKYHQPLLASYDPVFGMCFAIPQWTFNRIGYLDENFYMAHGEIDYGMRIIRAGMMVGIRMDCFVYHKGKVSANVNPVLVEKWNKDSDYFNQKWGGKFMRYK